MTYYKFSDGARVSLTKEEEDFLGAFKQSIIMTELSPGQLKLAFMLVNKSVLNRKKKNGDLYYVKENKK